MSDYILISDSVQKSVLNNYLTNSQSTFYNRKKLLTISKKNKDTDILF